MRKCFSTELLFAVIIFLARGGKGLKCYVCRSDESTGCGKYMNKSYLVECPTKPGTSNAYCRKIHQELRFKDENDYICIRECAYERGPKDCYTFKYISLAYQDTCECEGDSCNRGYTLAIDAFPVITCFMIILNYFQGT